jgi:hypothetical protein
MPGAEQFDLFGAVGIHRLSRNGTTHPHRAVDITRRHVAPRFQPGI